MLSLNEIQKPGHQRRRKRVGRGNASGHGTYSTRGLKGQKSRSGVSNLKRLGMRMQLLQTPKVRGFKSDKLKNQAVSVKAINAAYKDGEVVSLATLKERGLISNAKAPAKILGKEKLIVKVAFDGVKLSTAVADQVK